LRSDWWRARVSTKQADPRERAHLVQDRLDQKLRATTIALLHVAFLRRLLSPLPFRNLDDVIELGQHLPRRYKLGYPLLRKFTLLGFFPRLDLRSFVLECACVGFRLRERAFLEAGESGDNGVTIGILVGAVVYGLLLLFRVKGSKNASARLSGKGGVGEEESDMVNASVGCSAELSAVG
jgi:hypothetical protein